MALNSVVAPTVLRGGQVNVRKIVMKMSGSVILLVTGKILSKPKFILAFGFIKLSLGCRMLLCVTAGLCGASLCTITNIWTN